MLSFLGRALIVLSLGFSAFSLYGHSETISKFNSNLPSILKQCGCVPADVIKIVTEQLLAVRLAVVGLLALSAFLLIKPSSKFLTFLVLVGNAFLMQECRFTLSCLKIPGSTSRRPPSSTSSRTWL